MENATLSAMVDTAPRPRPSLPAPKLRRNMTLLAAGLPLRTSAYLIIWIIGMIIMSKPISATIHKRIMKRKSVCI